MSGMRAQSVRPLWGCLVRCVGTLSRMMEMGLTGRIGRMGLMALWDLPARGSRKLRRFSKRTRQGEHGDTQQNFFCFSEGGTPTDVPPPSL